MVAMAVTAVAIASSDQGDVGDLKFFDRLKASKHSAIS
jgi:hypothetical protein